MGPFKSKIKGTLMGTNLVEFHEWLQLKFKGTPTYTDLVEFHEGGYH